MVDTFFTQTHRPSATVPPAVEPTRWDVTPPGVSAMFTPPKAPALPSDEAAAKKARKDARALMANVADASDALAAAIEEQIATGQRQHRTPSTTLLSGVAAKTDQNNEVLSPAERAAEHAENLSAAATVIRSILTFGEKASAAPNVAPENAVQATMDAFLRQQTGNAAAQTLQAAYAQDAAAKQHGTNNAFFAQAHNNQDASANMQHMIENMLPFCVALILNAQELYRKLTEAGNNTKPAAEDNYTEELRKHMLAVKRLQDALKKKPHDPEDVAAPVYFALLPASLMMLVWWARAFNREFFQVVLGAFDPHFAIIAAAPGHTPGKGDTAAGG